MGWFEIAGGVVQIIILIFKQIIEAQQEKKDEIKDVQTNLAEAIKSRNVAEFTYWRERASKLR